MNGVILKNRTRLITILFYVFEVLITAFLFYLLYSFSFQVGNKEIMLKHGVIGTFFTLGILAYLFGLRHALDADHLAAIDNSTRKLVQEKKNAHFSGFFFSLGHSTVVIALAIILMISTRIIASSIPVLENIGTIIGTLVSGSFLYIIGFLNFFVLLEVYKLYIVARQGKMDDNKLNNALLKRGFMSRYFRRLFKIVDKQYYLYPIGVLFGLGFDTASETALLAISAAAAGVFMHLSIWTLLVFPFLFTAGMTTVDTTDGLFMSGAYNWAFMGNPIKKVWYNLTMTTISIQVAYVVGTFELLGLVQSEFNFSGFFWKFIAMLNGGEWWGNIGLIIIGTFAITWALSFIIYKLKIERKYILNKDFN